VSRRSYDHYCAISRALDAVGERWTLLIVRELLTGPCRYSDLLADLPGISTDVLAARLREMERDGLVARRRVGTRGATWHYELTDEGERLRGVLESLGTWGGPRLAERLPTDALRGHWFALPLGRLLADLLAASAPCPASTPGTVEVRLDEGVFRLSIGPDGTVGTPRQVSRSADQGEVAAVTLRTTATTMAELVAGRLDLAAALVGGLVTMTGEGDLATALRRAGRVPAPTAPTP
jgi:DNA-binding HxlR family transcriptional regulator